MQTEKMINALNSGAQSFTEKQIEDCKSTIEKEIEIYFDSIKNNVAKEIALITVNLMQNAIHTSNSYDSGALTIAGEMAAKVSLDHLKAGLKNKVVSPT